MISAILLAAASIAPLQVPAGASAPPSSSQQPQAQPVGVPFRPPQAGPGASPDAGTSDGAKPAQPTISIEDEVLTNVKNEPVGAATVADMGYPDEYLRRVGDRIVRSSFEARYRVVVPDPKPQTSSSTAATATMPPKKPEPESSNRGFVIAAIVAVVLGLLYVLSTRGSRGGAA